MTAFVVFAPAVLHKADYLGIDVGDSMPVNVAGLYPIHESQRRFIKAKGLEAFWGLDWDPTTVTRAAMV